MFADEGLSDLHLFVRDGMLLYFGITVVLLPFVYRSYHRYGL